MTVYPPIECPGCGRKCSHLRQASRTDLSMVCVSDCALYDVPPDALSVERDAKSFLWSLKEFLQGDDNEPPKETP